jgi:beta-phosphoglucomutase-like phosphatase (HAD superfamily)
MDVDSAHWFWSAGFGPPRTPPVEGDGGAGIAQLAGGIKAEYKGAAMVPFLIFDCDGVLVDSELLEHAVDAELLAPYGCTASAEEMLHRFVGIARRDMYRVMFAELNREMPPGLLDDRERRVWELCASDLKPVQDVHVALDALNGFAKSVASSSTPPKLVLKLEATGLTNYFTPHIFSTAMVAHGKPAPDIYLHAAWAAGARPQDCLVIEDSRHGIAGARSAGMRAIGFTGGSHATPVLAGELLAAGAKKVVSHMRDLPAAIHALAKAPVEG